VVNTEKRQVILLKAMEVFQEYGYKRVNMKEIAESLHISRPGLYLYFKTKEEIFCAVVREFGRAAIRRAIAEASRQTSLEEKLHAAFEVFVVETFSLTQNSPEAKEISESSFEFASEALEESFKMFEDLLVSILREHRANFRWGRDISLERCSRLLVAATRGYKMVAKRSSELRKMIHQLLQMTLDISGGEK
jgi:TetR/AcrR family transcriptional regulator, regulator of autoinduction and epiphytic fitness